MHILIAMGVVPSIIAHLARQVLKLVQSIGNGTILYFYCHAIHLFLQEEKMYE